MGLSDKQTAKVTEFVQGSLRPGEQVAAVLGQGMAGPSMMLVAMLGALLAFMQKPYAVVVTDSRVLIVRLKMSLTGYPPKTLEADYPRSEVQASFSGGALTGRLNLERAGAPLLSLSIQRIYQDGAGAVAAELGRTVVVAAPA
jgi:hypothetical protein